jgi:hypothetical protein
MLCSDTIKHGSRSFHFLLKQICRNRTRYPKIKINHIVDWTNILQARWNELTLQDHSLMVIQEQEAQWNML